MCVTLCLVCDSNPATALNDAKPAGVIAVAILIMIGDKDGLIYPYADWRRAIAAAMISAACTPRVVQLVTKRAFVLG